MSEAHSIYLGHQATRRGEGHKRRYHRTSGSALLAAGVVTTATPVVSVRWAGAQTASRAALPKEAGPAGRKRLVEYCASVTPSAVSQHLKVLHGTGLVTRTRAGRNVLYHRSPLGDRLVGHA